MGGKYESRILTLGYTGASISKIATMLLREGAVLVDVRFMPFSRAPMWSKSGFTEKLGAYPKQYQMGPEQEDEHSPPRSLVDLPPDFLLQTAKESAEVWAKVKQYGAISGRYLHIKEFGNRNFKQPGMANVVLDDPQVGVQRVYREVINRGFKAVLMCACEDPMHCHRYTVANVIKDALQLEYEHIPLEEIVSESRAAKGDTSSGQGRKNTIPRFTGDARQTAEAVERLNQMRDTMTSGEQTGGPKTSMDEEFRKLEKKLGPLGKDPKDPLQTGIFDE